MWNYAKFSAPARHGDFYFYYANTGLQNQSVLYKQETLTSEPSVFLDPNTLSLDGTVALSGTAFSDDGQYFAYGLSESGSDWLKIKIRNVATGEDYAECLEKVKFSAIAWTKDNKGLFYCVCQICYIFPFSIFLMILFQCYPTQGGKTDGSETAMNENQKMYYHRVGEAQSQDVLVVEFLDKPTYRM